MSINFNRNRTQEAYESILGISSPSDLSANKDNFKNHVLSDNDVATLKPQLMGDALDFFHNGVISFSEGIDAMYEKRFSWATVKLYYSVFYLLRASMACNNIALIRNANMYRLKIQKGEKPFPGSSRKYNSTHEGTILHYRDVFAGVDRLLGNKIEDVEAYQWMEDVRNIVNYRDVAFRDPDCLDIWIKFKEALLNDQIDAVLNTLLNDDMYIYCFQEDYAVVAIPIKRLQQTIEDMSHADLLTQYQQDRFDYAKTVLKSQSRNLHLIDTIKP